VASMPRLRVVFREIVNHEVTQPPGAFDCYHPAQRFRGFPVLSRSWEAAMITRSMLSRLIITLGMLALCALSASAWRTQKPSKRLGGNISLALAIGER
jgi:hypothetical protein